MHVLCCLAKLYYSVKMSNKLTINTENSLVQKELKESHFVIKSTVNTNVATTFIMLEVYFYP